MMTEHSGLQGVSVIGLQDDPSQRTQGTAHCGLSALEHEFVHSSTLHGDPPWACHTCMRMLAHTSETCQPVPVCFIVCDIRWACTWACALVGCSARTYTQLAHARHAPRCINTPEGNPMGRAGTMRLQAEGGAGVWVLVGSAQAGCCLCRAAGLLHSLAEGWAGARLPLPMLRQPFCPTIKVSVRTSLGSQASRCCCLSAKGTAR